MLFAVDSKIVSRLTEFNALTKSTLPKHGRLSCCRRLCELSGPQLPLHLKHRRQLIIIIIIIIIITVIHCTTRLQRDFNLNDIIWRAVNRAQIPAVKEPVGLSRSDGQRPDGATLIL